MEETKAEFSNIAEIGERESSRLVGILDEREASGHNSVGWDGTSEELRSQIKSQSLCPASAFAVVSEGFSRYRRQEGRLSESIESLHDLAGLLASGADIFEQALKVDKKTLLDQIREFVNSHGGSFDEKADWKELIEDQSRAIKERAHRLEEVS